LGVPRNAFPPIFPSSPDKLGFSLTSPGTMESFIHGLPKLELHLHIEGTLTPERKLALAKRNALDIGHETPESIRETYQFDSLASFLAVYYDGMKVLLKEPDFYDLAMDYLKKAASQNVRYVEMFFDPQAHTGRGVPFEYIIKGLARACTDAVGSLGITGRLIMCFLRDHEVGWAEDILTQSIPYKKHIIGVGLDSDENHNPPEKFEDVFKRARELGYKLTMHADVDQENTVLHIACLLHTIGVDRIDHGVNAVGSPKLTEAIAAKPGMGLTVCPISNGYVTGHMCEDRIRELMKAGVKVTINSDDPSYMGERYVEENLVALWKTMNLSKEDLVLFQKNAVEISWADKGTKEKLLKEIDEYVATH
jgi:adenine deaminase